MDISFLFSGSPGFSGLFAQLFSFFQGAFVFLALARGSRGRRTKGGRKGKQQVNFREKAARAQRRRAQESSQMLSRETAPAFTQATSPTVPERAGSSFLGQTEEYGSLPEFTSFPPSQPSMTFDDDEVILVDDDEVILVDDDEVILVDDDEVILVDDDEVILLDNEEDASLAGKGKEEIGPETTTPLFERKEEVQIPAFGLGKEREIPPKKREAEGWAETQPSYGLFRQPLSFERQKTATQPLRGPGSPCGAGARRIVREGEEGFSLDDELENMDFKNIENVQRRMRLNRDVFEIIEKKFPGKVELEDYLQKNDEWWDEWERSL